MNDWVTVSPWDGLCGDLRGGPPERLHSEALWNSSPLLFTACGCGLRITHGVPKKDNRVHCL